MMIFVKIFNKIKHFIHFVIIFACRNAKRLEMKKKFTDKQIMILDVAEELIARKGYEGTSVRDICSKAGINVAMISYYFGSKEKMLAYLYQYRVQKTRANFAEFAHTIRDGKPEMQVKEIIRFIIGQMFRYKYFHGFVKQEMRNTDIMDDELQEFYKMAVEKFDEVIRKGVGSGVFQFAPHAEDVLTMVIGSALFVIRNKKFYEQYLPNSNDRNYLEESEKKIRTTLYQTIFSLLGYQPEI